MSDEVTTEAGRVQAFAESLRFYNAGYAAGRAITDALLYGQELMDVSAGQPERYLAMEREMQAVDEAVENERQRLYEAVEGWHNATKERGPVEEGERRAFRAVLALLAPPAEKEQT